MNTSDSDSDDYDQRNADDLSFRKFHPIELYPQLESFTSALRRSIRVDTLIGNSKEVVAVKNMIDQLNKVKISSIIISGETGTGKGLLARILHHSNDFCKEGPLVEVNCAGLPRELMESEIFGHEAGAFTGAKSRHRGYMEQANGGTLFLDEIADMPMDLQTKLLKAIEDKKIRRLGGEREITLDVQIIAASNANLKEAVAKSAFRSDLYHRLSVFSLSLPPLRVRKNDLFELVPGIIKEFNLKANKRVKVVPDEVWKELLAYDWPGNIRELRNVIERCVLMSKGEYFPACWLQLNKFCSPIHKSPLKANSLEEGYGDLDISNCVTMPLDGSMSLEEMKKYVIHEALKKNKFNVMETARRLGTTRETLRYRIKKYNLHETGIR